MTVTSTNQKVQFNGSGSTTVFAYNFKIFAQTDLSVILRSATGTETVQQLTTNYTVSGVGAASGGNVTMGVAPPSGTTLTILRVQPNLQGLDLVPNDPFPAGSMEDALDKLTFMVQTHDEEIGRSIKASKTNVIADSEFTVSATDRANKLFSFDGSGNLSIAQELGTYRGDWAASTTYAVRDLVKDTSTNNIFICITAHTSSGSQPLTTNTDSAKWALIVDAASATTSASTATTKASEAAASAVLASQWAIKTDDTVDGTNYSAKYWATRADVGAVAGKATEIGLLGNSTTISNMNLLGTSDAVADMNTLGTSSNVTNQNTLAGISGNITTVAGIASNVTAVAGDASDIGAVAGKATEIGLLGNSDTVADLALLGTSAVVEDLGLLGTAAVVEDMGLLANSTTIANMAQLGTSAAVADMAILGTSDVVADMAILGTTDVVADMNTLGTSDVVSDMNTLATSDIVTDMNLLATSANVAAMGKLGLDAVIADMALLGTDAVVADLAILGTTDVVADMNTLATSDIVSDMNTLATSANVTAMGLLGTSAVVTDMGLLGTAAVVEDMGILGTSANVTAMSNVSGSISNVNTVATNLSGITAFSEVYSSGGTDPSSNLNEGDLFFNTSSDALKVYDGSNWVAGVTAGSGFLPLAGGTMTGNLALGDNVKAIFGAGPDLAIYHDGTNSLIDDTDSGFIAIRSDTMVKLLKRTGNENMVVAVPDGAVSLYYDNAVKLATTSTGVDVTGSLVCDSAISIEASSGFANIEMGGPDGAFIDFKAPFSDDYDGRVQWHNGDGLLKIATNSDNAIVLQHNNSTKIATTSTGVEVTGNVVVSGTVDGVDLQTLNTAVSANTSKTTNATHSGEVTGSGALTIADNVVDEANLKVSNSPVNGYALTAQSGNTGGLTWAEISSGASNVVFPNFASPNNTYTSSGTWSKGSLADDDFVWFYGINGGDGGGAYFAVNLGGAAFAGHAGKASLFYGKASIFNGASYVVGAGGAGSTSNIHPAGGASTLTLSSGLVLSNSSDDNVPDYVMGSSGIGTYITSTFSPDVNFTLNLPITVSSVAYAQSGLNQQTLNNTLFGGHGAFGSSNASTAVSYRSLFGGANGASLGAAGSAPGGAGAGNTSGTGGAGATGSWRVYHV